MSAVREYSYEGNPNCRILAIESGPVDTWGYLVADLELRQAFIVDVPYESLAIFTEYASKYSLEIPQVILTHSHWDHSAETAELCRFFSAKLFVHPDDEYRLVNPMQHTVWKLPFSIQPCKADGYIHSGDVVQLGNMPWNVIHVPGHTEGSIALYSENIKVAIAGDALFAGSIGRTDLPGGNYKQLLNSIASTLLALPDDVVVLPGHGPATSIGVERKENPFLQWKFPV